MCAINRAAKCHRLTGSRLTENKLMNRGNTALLGAFVKLRKATISFAMSASPYIWPHGTTPLQLDRFS
jgi:hypothetical protein